MTEKEYIADKIYKGKIVWKDDDEHLAQYLIDNGVRYFPNKNLALSKIELCVLRAIVDLRNKEYESAEEQLMNARKILEDKEN